MTNLNKVLCLGILGFISMGTQCVREVGVDENVYTLLKCQDFKSYPKNFPNFAEDGDWVLSRDVKAQVSCEGFSAYHLFSNKNSASEDSFLVSYDATTCVFIVRRRALCDLGRTDEECAKPRNMQVVERDKRIAKLLFGKDREVKFWNVVWNWKTVDQLAASCKWGD